MDRLQRDGTLSPEVVAGILRTPRWALQSALAELTARYGGIEGYLRGPAQVAPGPHEVLVSLGKRKFAPLTIEVA